jgi:hypothetical protein
VEIDGHCERSEIGVTPSIKRAVSCARGVNLPLQPNIEDGVIQDERSMHILRVGNLEKQRKVEGTCLFYQGDIG